MASIVDFRIGDVIRLRKAHPCGGFDWKVTRVGADVGLRCVKCDHRVLLPRSTVERRLKAFISRGEQTESPPTPTPPTSWSTEEGVGSSGE